MKNLIIILTTLFCSASIAWSENNKNITIMTVSNSPEFYGAELRINLGFMPKFFETMDECDLWLFKSYKKHYKNNPECVASDYSDNNARKQPQIACKQEGNLNDWLICFDLNKILTSKGYTEGQ